MEIIVVLAVIGIISGVSCSGYYLLRKYQLETTVSDVEDLIYLAQHTAHLENTSTQVKVVEVDSQSFFQLINQNTVEKQVVMPKGIEVTIETSDKKLQFKADLTPVKGGTVSLKDYQTSRQIRLTIRPVTGKITRYNDL